MLPILPSDSTNQTTSTESIDSVQEAYEYIYNCLEKTDASVDGGDAFLEILMSSSLEKMETCLTPSRLARYNVSGQTCSSLFLVSLVRCNLEMELLLRGCTLTKPSQEDCCLVTKKPCLCKHYE